MAGVPPDYFSAQRATLGNPVYDWEALARTGYAWCIDRISALLAHVDVIRLDHFRAFAAAWHVTSGRPYCGNWRMATWPGRPGFSVPYKARWELCRLSPRTWASSPRTCPHFANGSTSPEHASCSSPLTVIPTTFTFLKIIALNTVVYTGTHDNPTTRQWFEGLSDRERRHVWNTLRRPEVEIRDVAPELVRLAWSSQAALAITPLQDVLNLGSEGRMNVPGSAEGNWRWRATPQMLSATSFQRLRDLTRFSNRSGIIQRPVPVKEAAS